MATWRKCCNFIQRQIIGALPGGGSSAPQDCLWILRYSDDFEYNCFMSPGWDFNGQEVDFTSVADNFGGYFAQNGNPFSIYGENDTCNQIYFFYEGITQPSDILITDPNFGQNPYSFYSYCDFGCITIPSFRYTQTYTIFNFWGLPTTTTSYGGDIDFSDPVNAQQIIEAIIKSYFPTATVTLQDDGGGFFTITFQNVWYNMSLFPTNNIQFFYDGGNQSEDLTGIPC